MKWSGALFFAFLCFLIAATVTAFTFNPDDLTEDIWNNGFCADCETRFELRGVDHSHKYYACPDCGQEVRRY